MQTSEIITSGKLTTITNIGGRTVIYNSWLGPISVPTVPEAIGMMGRLAGLMIADAATTTFENAKDAVSKLTKVTANENEDEEN